MKSTSSKMALKPYLEAMKAHCEGLSKEELVETLLNLAQEVPVAGRGEFLDKFRDLAPGSALRAGAAEQDLERVLVERIAALREEIEERISSIEDGTYWEDYDREEQGYYEEDPDRVSGEQWEELEHLFLETGGIFLAGQLESARRLYSDLFDLLASEDEIPLSLSRPSPILREGRARYCRCVYETTERADRVEEFFQCMDTGAAMNRYRLDLSSEPFPTLQDVIDARPADIPDLDSFLPAWEERLAASQTSRAAALRMEALERLEGTEGLSRLARQWKAEQPIGYLFWIQHLQEKGDWQGMLNASLEALQALPVGSFREQAAAYTVKAGRELGNEEAVLQGMRERFFSGSNEKNLIEFLEEAEKQNVRSRELEAALASKEYIVDKPGGRGDLYLKMLLMAGKLDEALSMGEDEASLGWSYGKAGVLFSAVLSVLMENSPKASAVQTLLKEYALQSYSFFSQDKGEEKTYSQILKGLTPIHLSQPEKEKYWAWAEKTGRGRVESIVSGQHRGAYDRAAQVLCALAETLVLSNAREKARALFNELLRVKFPRHHAFRKEVKQVIERSVLLKDLRVV